jgi:hypothetical protein
MRSALLTLSRGMCCALDLILARCELPGRDEA